MSDAKFSLAVLQRISEFLADLPEAHLADLADGKARLTFVPAGELEPWKPAKSGRAPSPRATTAAPAAGIEELREELSAMNSRDEGRARLNPLRMTQELRPLAKLLGVGRAGSVGKPEIIDAIVERTIGSRLNSAAIRQL